MWLNIASIDARIQKLQELKKIAEDPELVALLHEFMTAEPIGKAARVDPVGHEELLPMPSSPVTDPTKEVSADSDLIPAGNGIWGLRRR